MEYRDQGVKSFAVYPGAVLTKLSISFASWLPNGTQVFTQTADLSAWSYVRMALSSEDWLSSCFFNVTTGLEEVMKLKTKIIEQDAFKNTLALPFGYPHLFCQVGFRIELIGIYVLRNTKLTASLQLLEHPRVTGGGTGLGLAAAKAFAQTGAKIFISSRRAATLETAKAEIESIGGEVDFTTVDVTDSKSVEAGVAAAIKRFGKIDIVIANAGKDGETGKKLAEFNPEDWWSTVEASLKGSYFTVHATLPHLVASKGYIVLLSSSLAQMRVPGNSPYNIAKHSIIRLAEWIDTEYRDQGVKSFAVHPGAVLTELSTPFANWLPNGKQVFKQTPDLSAWSYVRLTSGSEDWLSGRFFNVTTDLDEVAKLKAKIIEQDAFKNRLALPF
ncbi:hypothetical protein FRB96_008322 [Tulasnella sp. 330]|nr:hypothetical protein FRB96_008322 [Tulasnella sp. 330]